MLIRLLSEKKKKKKKKTMIRRKKAATHINNAIYVAETCFLIRKLVSAKRREMVIYIYRGARGYDDNEPSRLDCVSFWSIVSAADREARLRDRIDDRGNDFYDETESKSRRGSDTDLAQLGQGRRPLELAGHTLYTRWKREMERQRVSDFEKRRR